MRIVQCAVVGVVLLIWTAIELLSRGITRVLDADFLDQRRSRGAWTSCSRTATRNPRVSSCPVGLIVYSCYIIGWTKRLIVYINSSRVLMVCLTSPSSQGLRARGEKQENLTVYRVNTKRKLLNLAPQDHRERTMWWFTSDLFYINLNKFIKFLIQKKRCTLKKKKNTSHTNESWEQPCTEHLTQPSSPRQREEHFVYIIFFKGLSYSCHKFIGRYKSAFSLSINRKKKTCDKYFFFFFTR